MNEEWFEVTENHSGFNYWFYEKNSRDKFKPHIVKILINDGIIIKANCTCIHGTIQIESKKKEKKYCTHIKKNMKLLYKKGVIKCLPKNVY